MRISDRSSDVCSSELKTVAVARPERRLGPLCPAHRQAHRLSRLRFGCGEGGAFVEGHSDGRLQQILDLDGPFRSQPVIAPVHMRAEGDAVGIELAQAGQRHDLEAARVGQERDRKSTRLNFSHYCAYSLTSFSRNKKK